MMDGWTTVALGDLCEYRRGLTYKKSDEVDSSSNAVLRANNINVETGEINFDEIRFIRGEIEVPDSKKVALGCLLVCTASGSKKHLGKIAKIDRKLDCAFGGFMGLLVPSKAVLPRYLFWLTRSYLYTDFIGDLSDGVNINNLKWSQLSQLAIPLPPVLEQERIVAMLDEAGAAIATATANAEKNRANAGELFESHISAVFAQKRDGWKETTLGESCQFHNGKAHEKHIAANGAYIVVNSKYISSGGSVFKRTNDALFPLNKRDIVMVMSDVPKGKALAKCSMIDEDGIYTLNQRICAIRSRRFESRFLFYHLNRHPF